MSRPKTLKIEKYYFERFCNDVGLDYNSFRVGKTPEPDIISGNRSVGVEITNLYILDGKDRGSEQQQSLLRDKIVKEAQGIYERGGGRKIDVLLSFNSLIDYNKKLAQDIAAYVTKHQNSASGNISGHANKKIPEVRFMYLSPVEYSNPKWRVQQNYSPPPLNQDRLCEVIENKEKKKYEGVRSCWLLIVMDYMCAAQEQIINEEILPRFSSKIFNRIILYDVGYGRVFNLSNWDTSVNGNESLDL